MDAGPDLIAARNRIGAILKLEDAGIWLAEARVVGQGSAASIDWTFSNGTTLNFDRASEIAKPMALKTSLAIGLGLARKVNGEQAIELLACTYAIAQHETSFTDDEISRDRGTSFLQVAPVIDIDISDQVARWRAFELLKDVDPVALRSAGEVASIAAGAPVLRHEDGTRYVRAGWFRSHVRMEESISSVELANRMQRVGWGRRAETGRIKATRPGFDDVLAWSFYTVPPGWEAVA